MNPPDATNVKPLVLIADDDELMRSLMAAALAEKGFETVEVSNGQEALAALPRVRPDLVLLDVDMPVMDGFAACQQIRNMEGGRDLPVVIVTGNEDTQSVDRAFDAGATDFVSKPVNWSLIGHRMRYVLRGARTHAALAESEMQNRAMLEALPDRLLLVSPDGEVVSVIEPASTGMQGQEAQRQQLRGTRIDHLLPEDATPTARELIRRVLRKRCEAGFEYAVPLQGTEADATSHFEARLLPQSSDTVLVILRDITSRKRTEEQIQRLAYYDSLTGLPNRHHFLEHCGQIVSNADSGQDRLALCFLDLDHFKRINDTLGHQAGDGALREIADRLKRFRERRLESGGYLQVARLSGDELVVIAEISDDAGLADLLEGLQAELSAPVSCDRHQLVITASIGCALFPEDGDDLTTLMKKADKAMSGAKTEGRNTCRRYSAAAHEPPGNLLTLESELRSAIDRGELTLYFQPKFNLQTGAITGAEALLRWFRANHGMIQPATFIPIAEETGLIVDIDRWVVDQACREIKEWRNAGLDPVPVSVNLSGREFCFDQPEITLQRALQAQGLEPSLLELEITETVLMADPTSAGVTLRKLKAMGIRLAVDDFGTGYSSLGYLKHFPLDVLKIDRAFIADLAHNESDRTLCQAMIAMARALELEVVAEGIETPFQRDFLKESGCDTGQGFLLGRPMTVAAFADLLATRLIAPRPRLEADGTGQYLR